MVLRPHDIIKFESLNKILFYSPMPQWVIEEKTCENFAVVRRMPITNKVPIGLRGKTRSQRQAAFIESDNIIEVIQPESLVKRISLMENDGMKQSLTMLEGLMNKLLLRWGIAGSLGFEIATQIKATSETSDIDVVIYVEEIDIAVLTTVYEFISELEVKVDVQVELDKIGSFVLADLILNYESTILIRTLYGPHLIKVENLKQIKTIEV
jgi:phosphoribosyl-dephospho-CoA transferase